MIENGWMTRNGWISSHYVRLTHEVVHTAGVTMCRRPVVIRPDLRPEPTGRTAVPRCLVCVGALLEEEAQIPPRRLPLPPPGIDLIEAEMFVRATLPVLLTGPSFALVSLVVAEYDRRGEALAARSPQHGFGPWTRCTCGDPVVCHDEHDGFCKAALADLSAPCPCMNFVAAPGTT